MEKIVIVQNVAPAITVHPPKGVGGIVTISQGKKELDFEMGALKQLYQHLHALFGGEERARITELEQQVTSLQNTLSRHVNKLR